MNTSAFDLQRAARANGVFIIKKIKTGSMRCKKDFLGSPELFFSRLCLLKPRCRMKSKCGMITIGRQGIMRQYLNTLEDEQTPRSIEEYLGAFTESLKMILHQNPVDRIGLTAMLAAKTALRLKAANPKFKEHEISHRLQGIARSVRLTNILKDLTPEEKRIIKLRKSDDSAALTSGRSNGKRKPAKEMRVKRA
jgi:hypothetical protein